GDYPARTIAKPSPIATEDPTHTIPDPGKLSSPKYSRNIGILFYSSMIKGSVVVPGAIIMVNNDLSSTTQNRLVTQLHIDEAITGQEFDIRLAGSTDYAIGIRILGRRLLVIRDHRDQTNRLEMDIVMFVKNGLISVTKNCFGPPGQTYQLRNIYWGAICIYNTDINRRCSTCSSCSGPSYTYCDGYGRSPYYPAIYDPAYPAENHAYWQKNQGCCNGCGGCCSGDPNYQLCRRYLCNSEGCIPELDCRLIKA